MLDATVGTATSESYCDIAFASTYFAARGVAAWALLTDEEMEQALRKGTEFIETEYFDSWKGLRTDYDTQALDWPRTGVVVEGNYVSSTIVPEAIKRACAEMAFKSTQGDIRADLTRGIASETIGPIQTVYDTSSPEVKRYLHVDAMLRPYLDIGSRNSITLLVERS